MVPSIPVNTPVLIDWLFLNDNPMAESVVVKAGWHYRRARLHRFVTVFRKSNKYHPPPKPGPSSARTRIPRSSNELTVITV